MNRLIPAAGNGGRIRRGICGGASGGVLLSIALLTAGWDLPIAAADDGTPVLVTCYQPPEVKPEHIILLCDDTTWAVDKIVWDELERRCWRHGPRHRISRRLRSQLCARLGGLFSGYDYAHRRRPSRLPLHERGYHQPKHRQVRYLAGGVDRHTWFTSLKTNSHSGVPAARSAQEGSSEVLREPARPTNPAGVHVNIVSLLVNYVRHIAVPAPTRSQTRLLFKSSRLRGPCGRSGMGTSAPCLPGAHG